MSSLVLDAEALYADLLRSMRQQLAASSQPPRLVGVASGGAWLAERLQKDLGLNEDIGILSSSMHRDDFSQRAGLQRPDRAALRCQWRAPDCG